MGFHCITVKTSNTFCLNNDQCFQLSNQPVSPLQYLINCEVDSCREFRKKYWIWEIIFTYIPHQILNTDIKIIKCNVEKKEKNSFKGRTKSKIMTFTILAGSKASAPLSIAALSQPVPALMGHWLAWSFTMLSWWTGHSLIDGFDVLSGAGELCWTGHPPVGAWVTIAALPPASDGTGVDELPPISGSKRIIRSNLSGTIMEDENIFSVKKSVYEPSGPPGGFYPGFRNMKQLGGRQRHCESKVPCPRTQHNVPGHKSSYFLHT